MESVARFVEQQTGLEVVILHEQANKGQTIIEKFETHAARSSYAIVILTGDDEGSSKDLSAPPRARARQNVVFEMGFFISALTRERVTVIYGPGVELPSDINGLVYVELERRRGVEDILGS
jgi:predicted nucleotide-binding protein